MENKSTLATGWHSLPAELRIMILKTIPCTNARYGALASVNREWSAVLERENFHTLRLGMNQLIDFRTMADRNQSLVRHVWLDIRLPSYTCEDCSKEEDLPEWHASAAVIRTTLSMAFSTLKHWKPTEHGLTLEISIHSPSDQLHFFKNLEFSSVYEDEAAVFKPHTALEFPPRKLHDLWHGWEYGGYTHMHTDKATSRVFMPYHILYFSRFQLPTVQAVTKFVVRRQVRRRFLGETLLQLCESFPNLKRMVYEPWRECAYVIPELRDRDYTNLMRGVWKHTSIKSVSIYEDTSDLVVPSQLPRNDVMRVDEERREHLPLAAAFAFGSRQLENLYASHLIDASSFFRTCQEEWVWDSLQVLTLTAKHLGRHSLPEAAYALLRKAATVAQRMPALHTMVLWTMDCRGAGAFEYTRADGASSITWRGHWDLRLPPEVVSEWDKVNENGRYEIRVEKELLKKSFGSQVIRDIKLPRGVIEASSLWQKLYEEEPVL